MNYMPQQKQLHYPKIMSNQSANISVFVFEYDQNYERLATVMQITFNLSQKSVC